MGQKQTCCKRYSSAERVAVRKSAETGKLHTVVCMDEGAGRFNRYTVEATDKPFPNPKFVGDEPSLSQGGSEAGDHPVLKNKC